MTQPGRYRSHRAHDDRVRGNDPRAWRSRGLTRGHYFAHDALDACGCAMGARFLLAGLVLAGVWYGWHWSSPWGFTWHVLAWSAGAALTGKIFGMATARQRRRVAGDEQR